MIIATGSRPSLPQIPGTDLSHVATVWEVLQEEKSARPGEYVLIYDQNGFCTVWEIAWHPATSNMLFSTPSALRIAFLLHNLASSLSLQLFKTEERYTLTAKLILQEVLPALFVMRVVVLLREHCFLSVIDDNMRDLIKLGRRPLSKMIPGTRLPVIDRSCHRNPGRQVHQ